MVYYFLRKKPTINTQKVGNRSYGYYPQSQRKIKGTVKDQIRRIKILKQH